MSGSPVSTLVYLHGFRSSPQSVKAQRVVHFVAGLPAAIRPRLHVPDLGSEPEAAVAGVAAWIAREVENPARDLTLVGSSLGGFYATHLAERFDARAVLINPAIRPYDDLQKYAGPQVNLYTGEPFDVLPAHFAQLRTLAVPVTRPERYFVLLRTGDEVLPWRESAAHYRGAWQYVAGGGDHGWTDFDPELPTVLRFAGVPA